MNKTKIITLTILIIVSFSLSFVGCGDEASSKNMEQIYAEQGIPVRTEQIITKSFSQSVEYYAVVSGIKESSAMSTFADKVESIKYSVGDYVVKDAVVLTFPTDNPKAQYYQAKLTFENAAKAYERMKGFFETGGLSRQAFDNSETTFRVAEANWQAMAQAVEVRAPISGIITRYNVRESENVEKETALFTVEQTDRIKARVWVADKDIHSINKGQKAIADWNDLSVVGKVIEVDLSMNQAKKAFAVDILFDNSAQIFRTGITAKITIETYNSENTIFVERKNIIKENTKLYVFLNQAGLARKQLVETGRTSGIDIEIISGLKAGDQLVIEGQMLLVDNAKLNVVTN